ncbi:OprD family outer membrane porin [bacterium]|nr:OprD family outer membrane porin [bacterium]MBU1435710.1 OprD family outer membrane porin [bacterium]MBU1502366.1 OprD family outer membrane porin [bacterium]
MNILKIITFALLLSSCSFIANAAESKPKRELKNNMAEVYNTLPPSVDNLGDIFTEGMLYGRLRMNAFNWDWSEADNDTNQDNYAFGLGGSLLYKTAHLEGFSATAGVYYSDSPFSTLRVDEADISYVKAGKDTFSRNRVLQEGSWNMFSLAQAYVQYDFDKTSFKAGRQIFESLLISSNDTKMIPNTFEGVSFITKNVPSTIIRGGYFYAQKLRDHTEFHDVITYNTASDNPLENQDDSAAHKGLSYANFKAAGEDTEHALVITDIKNKSLKDIQLDLTYTAVPHVLSSITGEINYIIKLPYDIFVTPGIRYMRQIDNGGGSIGGASLDGSLANWDASQPDNGYSDPKSLNGSLGMARLLFKKGPFITQIAYSEVADEADIVAPWRGFPTGGYTRAMSQYNWYANTKTTSAEVFYDFSKYKVLKGFSALARYAMQDFDESKQATGVQADSNILHLDLRQHISPELTAKLRVGLVDAEKRESGKDLDSYNEYRFEMNYLF